MSFPMPEPVELPFWGGRRDILKRDAMLIKVTADNGLAGFGPGPAHERAFLEIRTQIGPYLTGKDPLLWNRIEPCWDPETNKTFRAVEIALMDLSAKYEGCAVSELVGGRRRSRIKLYGSAGMYMEPDGYAREAERITRMGFIAYKMRPGMGPEKDLETVRKMREAVGGQMGLMIDAHTWWRMGTRNYSYETVLRLIDDMAAFSPVWLEEPLPPEDHEAYVKLRERSRIPLASGEHEHGDAGFEDLITRKAVDIVQMDLLCQGGVETARGIFRNVGKQGLRFAFHCWGTLLEVAAAAQLGICWPEEVVEWLEYPCYSNSGRPGMYPFPLSDDILKDPVRIEEGYLIVPDRPGLGFDVNEAVLNQYPYIPGPWSFFHLDSPRKTIAVTGDHSVKWIKGASNG